ncbi:MAG: transglycosylase domain-containing protein [Christensenellales bacterium]|jgi:penicillin-binding protein 2A
MKTLKRILIISSAALLGIVLLLTLSFGIVYVTGDKVRFDEQKFYQSVQKINFYDTENRLIEENNTYNVSFIKLNTLNPKTPQAFISIEDKEFYKHKGLNYKRILKALYLDVKNRNMAQGASTISQQLIKNTHLSSQKTISRKVNEIVLTKELEKSLNKNQILENYLNIIYFGDNCYGIENASYHYFSKSAKDLNLEESALLAGIISSPARYSPITKPENAKKRRNLVLNEMLKDGVISQEEFDQSINTEINLNLKEQEENFLNSYTEAALREAENILNLPAKQISLGGYKIYTFYNKEKQESLNSTIKDTDFQGNNYGAISINAKNGQVEAFLGGGNFQVLKTQRQPASVIKPILVYGPALNENIISPITQILDEEISISGYKAQNHDLQYHGYLTVQEAIEKSYNIPAVKTMSYVGLNKAKAYAKKANITFDQSDNNYSISLGGMTHGVNLMDLTGAYTVFSNNGVFVKPKFISYITDKDNNIVFIAKEETKQVFREDTAYLMNKMLNSASKHGTSKKLANLPYQVASKTGTVGKLSTNYDAIAVSYTTEDILGVWIGNFDNSPIGNIVGGTTPIAVTKDYFEKIYASRPPQNFEVPETIKEVEIDLKELETNHQIVAANSFLPPEARAKHEFSIYNLPKPSTISKLSFTPSNLDGKIENDMAVLSFEATNFLTYELYMNGILINTFENKKGKQEFKCSLPTNNLHTFVLKTKMKNYETGEDFVEESAPVKLLKTKNTSSETTNKAKWYM